MVTVTQAAAERLKALLEKRDRRAVRIYLAAG